MLSDMGFISVSSEAGFETSESIDEVEMVYSRRKPFLFRTYMKDGTIIKELLQYLAKLQQGKITLAQITPLAYCICLEVDFTLVLCLLQT